MSSIGIARTLVMIATFATLGGCVSSNGLHKPSPVRLTDGSYAGPSAVSIPNDIKQILSAGGLDTGDPSAPTDGTKVAEMAASKAPRAGEIEKLVANLDNGSKPAQVASAAQAPATPAPQTVAKAVETSQPNAPVKELALASATENKSPAVTVFKKEAEIKIENFAYPDIGAPSPEAPKSMQVASFDTSPTVPKNRTTKVSPSPRKADVAALSTEASVMKRPKRF